jgi:hypothetical protein
MSLVFSSLETMVECAIGLRNKNDDASVQIIYAAAH